MEIRPGLINLSTNVDEELTPLRSATTECDSLCLQRELSKWRAWKPEILPCLRDESKWKRRPVGSKLTLEYMPRCTNLCACEGPICHHIPHVTQQKPLFSAKRPSTWDISVKIAIWRSHESRTSKEDSRAINLKNLHPPLPFCRNLRRSTTKASFFRARKVNPGAWFAPNVPLVLVRFWSHEICTTVSSGNFLEPVAS